MMIVGMNALWSIGTVSGSLRQPVLRSCGASRGTLNVASFQKFRIVWQQFVSNETPPENYSSSPGCSVQVLVLVLGGMYPFMYSVQCIYIDLGFRGWSPESNKAMQWIDRFCKECRQITMTKPPCSRSPQMVVLDPGIPFEHALKSGA